MLEGLEKIVKPYRGRFPSHTTLPGVGREREEILREMEALRDIEAARWEKGFASGAIYHGDAAHIEFLNRVYAIHSQSNPLHPDLWPSTVKCEAEVVSMTADMLGANRQSEIPGLEREIVGTVSSGGTESILLAMKTYRDWARDKKKITEPEMIVPVSGHAAFDKAAQFFNMRIVRTPLDAQYRADVEAIRRAITRNTVVIVGSAPSFPHGVVDPIQEMSEVARERGIGFHTDACLGGFLLPWAEKMGYTVPPFDFRLPGVTSMSADTHKFGYAPKGSSVVLYRGADLRHYQYFTATDWPGGLYFSPAFAGSRPGALSAACWAAMVSMGEDGYLRAARSILETAAFIRREVASIPELRLIGDSLFIIAFGSDGLDIYSVMDAMSQKQWSLNGLQDPPGLHLCVTLRHAQPGVAERFVADLREAVAFVKAHPEVRGAMAAVYGLAAGMPLKGLVANYLKRFIDLMYEA